MMPFRKFRAGLLLLMLFGSSIAAMATQPHGNLRYSVVIDKFENKPNRNAVLHSGDDTKSGRSPPPAL